MTRTYPLRHLALISAMVAIMSSGLSRAGVIDSDDATRNLIDQTLERTVSFDCRRAAYVGLVLDDLSLAIGARVCLQELPRASSEERRIELTFSVSAVSVAELLDEFCRQVGRLTWDVFGRNGEFLICLHPIQPSALDNPLPPDPVHGESRIIRGTFENIALKYLASDDFIIVTSHEYDYLPHIGPPTTEFVASAEYYLPAPHFGLYWRFDEEIEIEVDGGTPLRELLNLAVLMSDDNILAYTIRSGRIFDSLFLNERWVSRDLVSARAIGIERDDGSLDRNLPVEIVGPQPLPGGYPSPLPSPEDYEYIGTDEDGIPRFRVNRSDRQGEGDSQL